MAVAAKGRAMKAAIAAVANLANRVRTIRERVGSFIAWTSLSVRPGVKMAGVAVWSTLFARDRFLIRRESHIASEPLLNEASKWAGTLFRLAARLCGRPL